MLTPVSQAWEPGPAPLLLPRGGDRIHTPKTPSTQSCQLPSQASLSVTGQPSQQTRQVPMRVSSMLGSESTF